MGKKEIVSNFGVKTQLVEWFLQDNPNALFFEKDLIEKFKKKISKKTINHIFDFLLEQGQVEKLIANDIIMYRFIGVNKYRHPRLAEDGRKSMICSYCKKNVDISEVKGKKTKTKTGKQDHCSACKKNSRRRVVASDWYYIVTLKDGPLRRKTKNKVPFSDIAVTLKAYPKHHDKIKAIAEKEKVVIYEVTAKLLEFALKEKYSKVSGL